MRTKATLFMIIIIMLLSTGCWDQRELSNMVITPGVAIDETEDGKICLTILVPIPKTSVSTADTGKSSSDRATLISETGEGIMDAFRKIEMKLSREVFFAQLDCIIIGENLARNGVSEVLDFFSRYREPPLKAFILFTKGEAADILKTASPLENNPVAEIRKLENLNVGVKMTLKDFLYELTETGINPISPLIEKVPVEKGKSDSSNKINSITGAAVFNKDKLAGWLNYRESKGVLWLKDQVKSGIITAYIPEEKGGGKVAGRIIKSKTRVHPIINGNEIEMKVDIYTDTSIYENTSKLDLSKSDLIHYIEGIYAQDIRAFIQLTLEKNQKQLDTDVFGFGTLINGKYPKLWDNYYKKDWSEKFSKLKINIVCSVRILDTGYDTKSATRGEEGLIK